MMDKTAILVGGPILARGDQFSQGGTNFGSKNWSGGPILAGFSAKIGPAGPILEGTDFGVTCLSLRPNFYERLGIYVS